MTDIVDQLAANALTLSDKRSNLMLRAADEIKALRKFVENMMMIQTLSQLPRVGAGGEGTE